MSDDLPPVVLILLRDGVSPVRAHPVRNAVRLVARLVDQNGGTFAVFLELMTRPGFALARQYAEVTAEGHRLPPARLRRELEVEWRFGLRQIDADPASGLRSQVRPAPRR